jgi:hypothetical protein
MWLAIIRRRVFIVVSSASYIHIHMPIGCVVVFGISVGGMGICKLPTAFTCEKGQV